MPTEKTEADALKRNIQEEYKRLIENRVSYVAREDEALEPIEGSETILRRDIANLQAIKRGVSNLVEECYVNGVLRPVVFMHIVVPNPDNPSERVMLCVPQFICVTEADDIKDKDGKCVMDRDGSGEKLADRIEKIERAAFQEQVEALRTASDMGALPDYPDYDDLPDENLN